MKKEFKLSDWIRMCKSYDLRRKVIPVNNIKEFIKERNKIEEEFRLKIVGLVWGLSIVGVDFNVKYFNNEMVKLGKEYKIKIDKLAGKELI